jgi:RNA polymerase-binding protein DksA
VPGKELEIMDQELNLQSIRKELERQRETLLERIREEQEFLQPDVANPDRTDLALDYSSAERRTALLAQMEESLEEVEDALDRLDRGEYGNCINCGKPIPQARLEAIPQTPYCVDCQQELERRGY